MGACHGHGKRSPCKAGGCLIGISLALRSCCQPRAPTPAHLSDAPTTLALELDPALGPGTLPQDKKALLAAANKIAATAKKEKEERDAKIQRVRDPLVLWVAVTAEAEPLWSASSYVSYVQELDEVTEGIRQLTQQISSLRNVKEAERERLDAGAWSAMGRGNDLLWLFKWCVPVVCWSAQTPLPSILLPGVCSEARPGAAACQTTNAAGGVGWHC